MTVATRAVGPGDASRSAVETRARTVQAFAGGELDLLVLGGGIVGAGVARDAALRGLRVGLVEQHDFAYGTSSRSSRLLHGGIRYLAQGRLGLVREASREKKILQRIAPHLVQPMPFLFPTYRENRNWVLWQLKVGVKLYDFLCGGRNFEASSWLGRSEVQGRIPGLRSDGLEGAVRYFDGFTNDARLVLDTLRSAAGAGALVLNYCRFIDGRREKLWRCRLKDEHAGVELEVGARAVVNATGPWAETVPHSRVKLRLTKGVHLIVDRRRFGIGETIVMTQGKRILFAIPWGDRTVLGTTDTDFRDKPENVRPTVEDVEEVLAVVNRFFPQLGLGAGDLLGAWAGLRPLIADPHGKPSDISRSHEIREAEPFWWDVAGGKLTTYRLMGEQTVDRVLRRLGRWTTCRTAEEPLLGNGAVEGVSGLIPPGFSPGLVEHYCANEWALHLEDVLIRRSGWYYYDRNRAAAVAEESGRLMAGVLGWSEELRETEMAAWRRRVDEDALAVARDREDRGPARVASL